MQHHSSLIKYLVNKALLAALGGAVLVYSPREHLPQVLITMVAYLTNSPLDDKPATEPDDEATPDEPARPAGRRATR